MAPHDARDFARARSAIEGQLHILKQRYASQADDIPSRGSGLGARGARGELGAHDRAPRAAGLDGFDPDVFA
jgi:hypothetical protein